MSTEEAAADVELAEPRADALVESLRAFGYSPETAVADLVDNSVSAGARHVSVRFRWAGRDSWISVHDDGRGMDEARLREAMRPGSANPRDRREVHDLGRFGLGLKTASFSQCRRLSVVSSSAPGRRAARVWDLDHVQNSGRWEVFTAAGPVPTQLAGELLKDGTGTVVVWERIDRVLGRGNTGSELTERHFHQVAGRVADHLRMTFHRLLRGPQRVILSVDGRALRPWDPFGEDQPARQVLGDEQLFYRGQPIRVRSYVLPHAGRLDDARHDDLAGPRGWMSQQGFYVYRNSRLIVAGDWLGLRLPRDEVTKLARVQVDLPNTMDEDWQIDVRKSVARPPAALAPDLRRIADIARRASVAVYRHRGRVVERSSDAGLTFAWEQLVRGGRVSYRVNRSHPLVGALTRDGADGPSVEALVRLMEETVPVPLILLEHANGRDRQATPFEGAAEEAVTTVAVQLVEALRRSGLSDEEIRVHMSRTEPFADHPEHIARAIGEASQ